jgi:hypothetical protein
VSTVQMHGSHERNNRPKPELANLEVGICVGSGLETKSGRGDLRLLNLGSPHFPYQNIDGSADQTDQEG